MARRTSPKIFLHVATTFHTPNQSGSVLAGSLAGHIGRINPPRKLTFEQRPSARLVPAGVSKKMTAWVFRANFPRQERITVFGADCSRRRKKSQIPDGPLY
jgi:hypothetical protein